MFAGGTWSMDRSGANEDTYPMLVISRLITVTYLPIFQKWEEAKPKNLHVFHLNFLFTALMSQSGSIFDTICMVLLHQNLPQSKDVESIPHTEFHVGSTIFSCQTLMDCLCTCDAFHISNSIRCF